MRRGRRAGIAALLAAAAFLAAGRDLGAEEQEILHKGDGPRTCVIRYGSFEFGPGFREFAHFRFMIRDPWNPGKKRITRDLIFEDSDESRRLLESKMIGYTIDAERLAVGPGGLHAAALQHMKKKAGECAEYAVLSQRTEIVDGKRAIIIHTRRKKESFHSTADYHEGAFVPLDGAAAAAIVAWTTGKDFTPGQELWTSFYRSFREAGTGEIRLPFGSLDPVEGLEDYSKIRLVPAGQQRFSVEVTYCEDPAERRRKTGDGFIGKMIHALYKISLFEIKYRKKIGGKRALVRRFSAGGERMMILEITDDLRPGLIISIMGTGKTMRKYNPEIKRIMKTMVFRRIEKK